jgi:trehalose-6-phosphate synthase
MSTEIVQGIAYSNYVDFQHVNFISLFGGLFNDKTNLRVRYSLHVTLISYATRSNSSYRMVQNIVHVEICPHHLDYPRY